mgnify:CR=1 FL=1
MQQQRLLIGVGNTFRSDDGVGRVLAHQIAEMDLPGVDVVEATGEGAALMDAWQGYARVYILDAVSSGAIPGTIYRIEAHREPVPTGFFHYSTHAFSVAEAIELARSLDLLPERLILYGIEGTCFDHGVTLTPSVEEAGRTVVKQVCVELGSPRISDEPGDTDARSVSDE